jgi:hypothetical protein
MNSREKGKRGERLWRDELRANGFAARRGQQFSGSAESPDVVCDTLPWIHFEVKAVERLNIEEAMEQARLDCGAPNKERGIEKIPVVAHKRSFRAWLVTMDSETFFRLLRGDFELPPRLDSVAPAPSARSGPSPSANSLRRFPSDANLRGTLPPEDTCAPVNDSARVKNTNKSKEEKHEYRSTMQR